MSKQSDAVVQPLLQERRSPFEILCPFNVTTLGLHCVGFNFQDLCSRIPDWQIYSYIQIYKFPDWQIYKNIHVYLQTGSLWCFLQDFCFLNGYFYICSEEHYVVEKVYCTLKHKSSVFDVLIWNQSECCVDSFLFAILVLPFQYTVKKDWGDTIPSLCHTPRCFQTIPTALLRIWLAIVSLIMFVVWLHLPCQLFQILSVLSSTSCLLGVPVYGAAWIFKIHNYVNYAMIVIINKINFFTWKFCRTRRQLYDVKNEFVISFHNFFSDSIRSGNKH